MFILCQVLDKWTDTAAGGAYNAEIVGVLEALSRVVLAVIRRAFMNANLLATMLPVALPSMSPVLLVGTCRWMSEGHVKPKALGAMFLTFGKALLSRLDQVNVVLCVLVL